LGLPFPCISVARIRRTDCNVNFCRIHQTLRVTPAMEAGIAGTVWTLSDLLGANC
jgi:hypothetical protein